MKKTYIVITPLRVGGAEQGTFTTIPPGKPVDLTEEEGKPLVACGAIREADVAEPEAKSSKKGS